MHVTDQRDAGSPRGANPLRRWVVIGSLGTIVVLAAACSSSASPTSTVLKQRTAKRAHLCRRRVRPHGRFTGHHPGRSVRTHALPVLAGRDRQDDLHGRLRRDLAATDRLEPAGDRRERGHRISPRNHHPARRIDAGDLQRHAALSLQRGQEGRRHRRAGCGRDLVRGAGFGVGSSDSVDQHERATRVDFDHVTDLTGHHTSRRDAGTGGHRAPGYRSASHCSTGDLAPGHLAPAHLTAHHPVGRGRVRLLTEPGA